MTHRDFPITIISDRKGRFITAYIAQIQGSYEQSKADIRTQNDVHSKDRTRMTAVVIMKKGQYDERITPSSDEKIISTARTLRDEGFI